MDYTTLNRQPVFTQVNQNSYRCVCGSNLKKTSLNKHITTAKHRRFCDNNRLPEIPVFNFANPIFTPPPAPPAPRLERQVGFDFSWDLFPLTRSHTESFDFPEPESKCGTECCVCYTERPNRWMMCCEQCGNSWCKLCTTKFKKMSCPLCRHEIPKQTDRNSYEFKIGGKQAFKIDITENILLPKDCIEQINSVIFEYITSM